MSNALTELLTHYEIAGYDFAAVELSNGGSLTILLHDVAFLHAGVTATADGIKAINVDSTQFSHDLMAAGSDPAATLERMQKSLAVYDGVEATIIDGDPKLLTFFPKSSVSFANDVFVVFSAAYQDHFFDPKYAYRVVMANGELIEYRVLDRQYRADVAVNINNVVKCIPHHIRYNIQNPIVREWAKRQSKWERDKKEDSMQVINKETKA